MESPKSAAAVPSITELRKLLDYGDLTLPRCQTFQYDTRTFRGKFISSQGIEGSNLYLWKVQSHQQGLDEMTDTFLQGNGMLYWPDDPASPRHNRWQYSKHRIQYVDSFLPTVRVWLSSPSHHLRIRSLLKQLFFRQNLQQHRNVAYKHKRDRDKSDPFRMQKGGSKDDPIELTSVDDDTSGDNPPAARVTYVLCYCLIYSEVANQGFPDRTLSMIPHHIFSNRQLIMVPSTLIWPRSRQTLMPG
jgi:hypothetical protein